MAEAETSRISIKNILWATDFSSHSDIALGYALMFARRLDATLYLGHVAAPDLLQRLAQENREGAFHEHWRRAETQMAALLASGVLTGIKHQVLISEGKALERLANIVRAHAIDLLVVGTRGRTGLKRLLLGSVTEGVLQVASCPVMAIGPHVPRAPANARLDTVVCWGDFSEESVAACSYACLLTRGCQAQLILLHSVECGADVTTGLEEARSSRVPEDKLMDFVSEDVRTSCKVTCRTFCGPVAEAILQNSEQERASLIVMGFPHQDLAPAREPGFTPYDVILKAKCPVLTIRSSQHQNIKPDEVRVHYGNARDDSK